MNQNQKRKDKIHSLISPLPSKKTIRVCGIIMYIILNLVCIKILSGAKDTYTKCGLLIEKIERVNNYGNTIEKYFIVKYPNKIEEIKVNVDTFYRSKLNSKVCFTEEVVSGIRIILFTIFFICCMFNGVVVFYWIVISGPSTIFKNIWNKFPNS